MSKRFFLLMFIAILLSINIYPQKKDQYGNIDIKGLSQADMERLFGDLYKPGKIFKTQGDPREIREVIINGNKITTVLFNYGSICRPNYLGNIADLVWQGLGYGFEFGPLAAGEVVTVKQDGSVDTLRIVSDSFVLTTQGSYSPNGTLKWGWLPKSGYADPNSKEIARLNAPDNNRDGKPDSWPERWYSPGAGKYVWPAFLGDQATAPDEEVYFVVDDYTNEEFAYWPFPSDSSKRGLGLDMEVRVIQFNNPLAEDIIFLVYQITNASEKDINRAYFGMHGDPHVGGPSDYSDDRAYFIPPLGPLADPYPQRARSMVYAWDDDMAGSGGRPAGYFGWKFLESPTNSNDGIDNDDDGITDESPFNSAGNYIDGISIPLTYGISDVTKYTEVYGAPKPRYEGDEDGDWDPAKDDVGIDGIGPDSPNYPGPDFGEGDGVPSQAWYLDVNFNSKYDEGEPISLDRLPGYKWAGSETNFGLRDISESDQIGLRSFHAAEYTNSLPNVPRNNSLMWEWLSSDTINANQELLNNPGDNIFNFGTGPLKLEQGETQRFSMAILFGNDLNDLVLNAETSTRVLEADYRFAQPPLKPVVKAIPGDGRVKLLWDTRAENSVDPLTSKKDFQGYKIYRSRDYTFSDVYTITDGNGNPFLGVALFDPNTGKRAQWDLIDSLKGFHPIEYQGRAVKYYLGDNTGLVHEYVDSTVKNGITYYYAVVSYDGGSLEPGKELPPTESQAVILKDPITSELIFDVNTVRVTPNPLPIGVKNADLKSGVLPARADVNSTGKITLKVVEDFAVEEKDYRIFFETATRYNVLDSTGVTEEIISKDTVFVSLNNDNIQPGSVEVYDASNNLVDPTKYFVNLESGRIRGTSQGSFTAGQKFKVKYKFYPVYQSTLINNQDANPMFNGMKLYIRNDSLSINYNESGWINNNSINLIDTVTHYNHTIGSSANRVKYRADWEIRWNSLDTVMVVNGVDTTYQYVQPGDTVRSTANPNLRDVVCPFTIWNITDNKKATYLIAHNGDLKRRYKWDFGEKIVIQPQDETGLKTSYEVNFTLPPSGTNPIYPKSGDVYLIKNNKPFRANDEFIFSTIPAVIENSKINEAMNNIYVVPNPYVAYSISENPGMFPDSRGERDIQFRNLPSKCTIRIYTITGELVQTIHKDDLSSIAHWDLLTSEGQKIAYGVYIYHVDAPGAGEKIGRIAIIK